MRDIKGSMKYFLLGAIALSIGACTTPHRQHHMDMRAHLQEEHSCNEWIHHDHDDQHGGSYWHTHCMDDHK